MSYTDQQLQLALGKMLPDKIELREVSPCTFRDQYWIAKRNPITGRIKPTEWLHLCWLAEKTLTKDQSICYQIMLDFNYHATWQQRTEALAKVKGIAI